MSDVSISDTNPINLTAVVSGSSTSGYAVAVQYGAVTLGELEDTFATLPATLAVSVGSSTVPTGYSLSGGGDVSWSNTSATSLLGAVTLTDASTQRFDFTISVQDGLGRTVAEIDPRIIVKKLAM